VDVFSDFACPHCRDFALGTLADLREDYLQTSDNPAVRFRHFDAPIPVNDWSRPVANAARFIQDQHGDDAFFAFSTLAYNNQADYSWQRLGDVANELAADAAPCETISAASNATYDGVIDADKATAENRDIPGTPTIFVNNTQVDSEYQNISDAIERSI
jgi:protein-disulfide isomerase